MVDNKVLTYAQHRTGFSYFYPKRKVLKDGVSTVPLDIYTSTNYSRCFMIVNTTVRRGFSFNLYLLIFSLSFGELCTLSLLIMIVNCC